MKKNKTETIRKGREKLMSSDDGVSIQMIWNNLTGKNFSGRAEAYATYLKTMQNQIGFESGDKLTLFEGTRRIDSKQF